MPVDKHGAFHMNPQVARMHDADQKPAFGHGDPGTQEDAEHGHASVHHIELHPHGDGTHHTVTHYHEDHPEHTAEGTREEHGSLEEAHESQREKLEEEEHPELEGEEEEESAGADEY